MSARLGINQLPDLEHRRRVRIGWEVVSSGGNLSRFAERIGLSVQGVSVWLRRAALVDLQKALKAGPMTSEVRGDEALALLRLLKDVSHRRGGRTDLARCMNVSRANLSVFEKRFAPDGLDNAIADLSPEEADVA